MDLAGATTASVATEGESTDPALYESDAGSDPLALFRRWFDAAAQADVPQPDAMTLATAAADGRPSARMVLLKGVDDRGFVFFTNYESRKGQDLAVNPRAALVFWWPAVHRQVRVEGAVERVPAVESDVYFKSRAWASQVAAAASQQSRVIAGREVLDARVHELTDMYEGGDVPRPEYWGGYRLRPSVIEFWQGRPNRLHDRLGYRRLDDGSWLIERLSP